MKAARLHSYHERLMLDSIEEPTATGPLDVVVRIGGAGLCRTDLHIMEGQWEAAMAPTLPYTIGHENAGWVHEVGSAVSNVEVGDAVIVHPLITCGLCRACRAGDDMHCETGAFPGIDTDGGFAELLKTNARAVVKLDPATGVRLLVEAQRGHTAEPEQISLDMEFAEEGGEGPTPYEVLLSAAMRGDSTRFTRQDGVEETWRIMQPLLDAPPPVNPYEKGSWGPGEADRLLAGYGRWHEPWVAS